MARLFGSVKRSETTDDGTEIRYTIPAVAKAAAKGRARGNNRVKGLTSPEIVSVKKVGQADLPGQKLYEVVVEADR